MSASSWFTFASEALSSLFFPRFCSFCESAGSDPQALLCDSCARELQWIGYRRCEKCGHPLPGQSQDGFLICGGCLTRPPSYEKARYAVLYSDRVRQATISFKYYGALHLGRALSHIMAQAFFRHFQPGELDVIVPVPIHRRRLVSRGYNQSVVLGERLAAKIGMPLDRFSLVKDRDTPPQVGLTKRERMTNVRGSFAVSDSGAVRGKRVLLIDDVATTGSTVNEASKTLMRAGAARVCVLVLSFRSGPDVSIEGAPVVDER